MNKVNIKNYARLMFIITAITFTLSAKAFVFRDDPSSTWGGNASTITTINGNTVTYQNFFAENLTGNTIPALYFAVPFAYPRLDDVPTYAPLQWDNTKNGWYTGDFNNTGTSLTVTMTSSLPGAGSVLMGDIADITGTAQLPLNLNYNGAVENLSVTDNIPLFSLGAFAPNEIKTFDISFTYAYGNGAGDAFRTAFSANTLSAVPVPAAVWFFGTALGMLGFIKKRSNV